MTIFDVTFGFRDSETDVKEYFKLFIESNIKYINDIVTAKGWISYEHIANIFGIFADPDLVEKLDVYRYKADKKLDALISESFTDPFIYKYIVKLIEKDNPTYMYQ